MPENDFIEDLWEGICESRPERYTVVKQTKLGGVWETVKTGLTLADGWLELDELRKLVHAGVLWDCALLDDGEKVAYVRASNGLPI